MPDHPVDCEGGWIPCWNCGGDGFFDGYEDDPIWYDPGDIIGCYECGGAGGWPCRVCDPVEKSVDA